MRNQNNKGYFSVHRMMLNHWRFEDATEIGLWVTFASEFAYEECEVKGKFTGKPIKLKPNQQVFSTKQLTELLNGVWPGTKSGKKQLTRHMVNHRMDKWKGIGLIDWIDCECTTDGRLFTIKQALPNAGNSEAVSETKPAAPNIKKKANKTTTSKTKQFVRPDLNEVVAYAVGKGWPNAERFAEKFFDNFTETEWVKVNGEPVKSWKGTLHAWQKNEKTNFVPMLQSSNSTFKRTGKSTQAPSGLEALIASDTAATKLEEKAA